MPDVHETHEEMVENCINECMSCHALCVEATAYCLEMGGEHAEPEHIEALTDCAEMCRTAANFMLRHSDRHPLTCAICSVMCKECAESCERFEDDEVMQACVESCRACSAACEEMMELEDDEDMEHERPADSV